MNMSSDISGDVESVENQSEDVVVAAAAAAASIMMGLIQEEAGAEDGAAHDLLEEEEDEPRRKHSRRSYPRPGYMKSVWGQWLERLEELHAAEGGLDEDCREARQFVTAFRIPYEMFLGIVEAVAPAFPAASHDVAGRECIPVKLKVCAALKVLAAGNSFQDVASFSGMSVTSAETSFHLFCEKFSAALWDKWVKLPVGEELEKVEGVFRRSGYPGAIGSTDCTHFKWDGGPFSEARVNTGKEGYPTVAVEATCDHSGRIIAATKSYPGSENDKTIISRDKSVWRIRDEEPWSSLKYSLYNADGSQTEYKGAWLVVDGGYPKIPLLVPPIKHHSTVEEHAWSRRLESMRKDIECCYGRVKGRFRIFKGGILFKTRKSIDNAWFTVCILHNMLHHFNKLDVMTAALGWEGSAGPLGGGVPAGGTDNDDTETPSPGFEEFRAKLVAHFTVAWAKREVVWFQRANLAEA